MEETNVKLSSPWEQIHHTLIAFFATDSDIAVDRAIDYDTYELGISFYNAEKYDAAVRVLKTKYDFGNVTFKINLNLAVDRTDEADGSSHQKMADAVTTLLTGNELFVRMQEYQEIPTITSYFCVFVKKVIQYFDDNIQNPSGLKSTIAEDMARDIFSDDVDVFFTTDSDTDAE